MPDKPKTLKYSISVSSKLTNLVRVLEWFEACQSDHMPNSFWLPSKIALAEAFTNAVRHAHRRLPETTPVQINLSISRITLELEVIDYGAPFDLLAHLARQPKVTDLYATHGRGLKLLESIADRLEYRRLRDGRNCLYFQKHYSHSA
ncbi:MAG: ATP-binding protein [Oscillatoriales cyanobacterium]|jgi:serine/threonine-protein kinase RsbW|nr:MAG: ATP-binding protein [Oscillatoriales cyanobacterium]